ncbi:MAG: pyruvate dehydrogenase (acetyl-transferring), homodimeric type, partial [Verrucomicrobiae bacterium]|nr:pyruvate dehydrogenase (acetyl-transferring), homodimeric type [Verrucomicrobiae bacterium]
MSQESVSKSGELQRWVESLEHVLGTVLQRETAQAGLIMNRLVQRLRANNIPVPEPVNTPYINTIPADQQPPYPGNRELERRIKSYIRWNAMAMVVKANSTTNVGGHISTYASLAT